MLLIILFRSISHEHKILTIIYSRLFRDFLVTAKFINFINPQEVQEVLGGIQKATTARARKKGTPQQKTTHFPYK
jgi:hypothetical protein